MLHLEMIQKFVNGAECPACQHQNTLFATLKCDRDSDGRQYRVTCEHCNFRMLCEFEVIPEKTNVLARVFCEFKNNVCHLALDPVLYKTAA